MGVSETVRQYIGQWNLINPQETVLAAVSGGADSLCLLLVMKELGYPVRVAHFDHGLRAESVRDSEAVRRFAEKLNIPCHVGRGKVREHATHNRMTVEEAARKLRYDFLFRTAMECRAAVIATGHTMDDQAETVLMHLLRGSGIDGLRGIRPIQIASGGGLRTRREGVRIVRPLLCLSHAQTLAYCQVNGWQPLEDPSNKDLSFRRNRVRQELIPQLRQYNPEIIATLCKLSEIAAAHTEFMEEAVHDFWSRSVHGTEPGPIRIDRDAFNRSPMAVRQALVRRAVCEIKGDLRDLDYRHVNRVIEFSLTPTSTRRMNLALGIDASIEGESLILSPHEGIPSVPEWENLPLPDCGSVTIRRPKWEFSISSLKGSDSSLLAVPEDPWTIRIAAELIHPPLHLRKRAPGDRFFPAGMPGPVKLSDFFASHHLPARERDRWPLVCDGIGILWIPGYRLRKGAACSRISDQCVVIRVERSP